MSIPLKSLVLQRKALSAILFAALAVSMIGCNIMGAAADKLTSDPQTPAAYVPLKDTMVVVVENWQNPAGSATECERISRFIYDDLRMHNVCPLVDPVLVTDLKTKRSDFASLSITQIGKLVGAQQVLYVNVTESSLSGAMGADALRGRSAVRVKIQDVATGRPRWPTDSAGGFPVAAKTPVTDSRNARSDDQLQLALQRRTAVMVARLFYKSAEEQSDHVGANGQD